MGCLAAPSKKKGQHKKQGFHGCQLVFRPTAPLPHAKYAKL